MKRPNIQPDWKQIIEDIKKAKKWTDNRLAIEMELLGAPCDRSSINYLMHRRTNMPRYDIGTALVWLHETTMKI